MTRKMYWGLAILIVLLIGVTAVLLMRTTDTEPKIVYKGDVEPSKDNPPPAEPGFKWVWHHNHWDRVPVVQEGELPSNPIEVSTSDWTPAQVQIPKDITDPDVKAAWERLEDISKNRHKWGQFSPRALELMNELTPVPTDPYEGEDCGEGIIFVLEELASLRDPRSAELLLSYQMDSGIHGRPPNEALAAMGSAAVPALVARLNIDSIESHMLDDPLNLLAHIVAIHRSELGGIVEHIIIPKMEAIAAVVVPEDTVGVFTDVNKQFALNALETIRHKHEDW